MLSPRFLSHVAPFDAASNICAALSLGDTAARDRQLPAGTTTAPAGQLNLTAYRPIDP